MRIINKPRMRLAIAGTSALGLAILGLGATTTAAHAGTDTTSGRTAFPGSVPSFVTSAGEGGTPADATEEGEIYLSLPDQGAAQQFATQVSTPGSRLYGHYLTPQAWISKYAPSKSDLAAVEKYLTDNGFTITGAPASREYVVFRGTPDQFDAAFSTRLRNYTVDGTTVSAPSTAPSLPTSVASHVLGLELGNARARLTRTFHQRQGQGVPGAKLRHSKTLLGDAGSAGSNSTPVTSEKCSSYYDQYEATRPAAYGKTSFPTFICGYVPGQLRSAGNVDTLAKSGVDGRGITIGIVDAYDSPTLVQDTNSYMQQVGSPLLKGYSDISDPASSFSDEADCQEPSGWQTEQTMDVQSAHSIAPGAKIVYSGGYNCGGGLDLALSKILDQHRADLVSNSYGDLGEGIPADVVQGELNIQVQAAGEGIGLYFSSGDDGDDSVDFGKPATDFPATSPFVTAVGGTTQYVDAQGTSVAEVGWGDLLDQVVDGAYTSKLPGNLFGGGGGGGISSLFAQPWYQRGVVPTSLSGQGSSAARVEPDVSDLGDPYTGFQIAVSPITDDSTLATGPLEFQTWGGTSLASPIVAAKMALVQQASHRTIGFANPLLYQQSTVKSGDFNDLVDPGSTPAMAYTGITSGKTYLVTQNQGQSLTLTKGYDDFSGIGTLRVPDLAADLRGGSGRR